MIPRAIRRSALILALLTIVTGSIEAQVDSTTIFGRVVMRRLVAMEQDTSIQILNQAGLLGNVNFANIDPARLDDATLVTLFSLVASAMERAGPDECLAMMAGAEIDSVMLGFLSRKVVDSLEAEAWAGVIEMTTWAVINNDLPLPASAVEDIEPLIEKLALGLDPDRQRAIAKAQQRGDDGAACQFVPWLIRKFVAHEPARAGALMRGFLAYGERNREK